MASLQIIGAAPSNYVWTTRIACEEKGVAYELIPARPHSPEISAVSPIGKIPVMRHGDFELFESKAICTYIDLAFPGPALAPRDPQGAAKVEQWASCLNTSVDPVLMRQYGIGYIFPGTPDKSPNRAMIDPAIPKMEKMIAMLDGAVAKTGFLVGESFTIADMTALPILHYMRMFPESAAALAKATALTAYIDRHMARPSVQRSKPPPPGG